MINIEQKQMRCFSLFQNISGIMSQRHTYVTFIH